MLRSHPPSSRPLRAFVAPFAAVLLAAVPFAFALQGAPAPGSAPASATPPATPPAAERPKTVIVVRHAEKDPAGDPKDPHLGEAGQRRAVALAGLLAKSGATALYSSEYHRTRDTLAPLAAKLGREVEPVPARDAAALVDRVEKLPPGSTVVVAGHSNTVPDLLARFGAELPGVVENGKPRNLDENVYGRVFVLTVPPAGARPWVATSVLELSTDP